MSNRLPILVVIGAVLLFLVYSAIFVVNERQQAIVLRFGEIVDVKTEPGLYFKLPFAFLEADNVQIIEDRIMRFDLDDIRVQVSGGKFYEVDAFVVYKITKSLHANKEKLAATHGVFKNFHPETMNADFGLPYHSGAEKFFKEAGL